MITCDQFTNTVTAILQRGQGNASGIYTDWVRPLVPLGMINLAKQHVMDGCVKGTLAAKFTLTLDAEGACQLGETERQLYTPGLEHAACYDSAQLDVITDDYAKLIYKLNFHLVEEKQSYLDGEFSYFALRDRTIITKPSLALGQIVGPLFLYCTYIPDFTEQFPLPYELFNEATALMVDTAASLLKLPTIPQ